MLNVNFENILTGEKELETQKQYLLNIVSGDDYDPLAAETSYELKICEQAINAIFAAQEGCRVAREALSVIISHNELTSSKSVSLV